VDGGSPYRMQATTLGQYLLFGTHPTLADRVAMADAWAARRR